MFTRGFFVRTTQVLCISTLATLASTAPASSASATAQNVACSQTALRDAIDTANASPDSNTLNLARNCPYQLTTELPAITTPITINGNSATLTRTSGSFRILTVDGGNLTLRSAVIADGDATGSPLVTGAGGGIVVTGNGTLTVTGSVIKDNHADFGGGISVFNGSQAHLTGTVVRGNSATRNGGGLVNDGTLTVKASQISRNTADGAGGGIANIGTLTVTASNIADNTAQTGGGIANGVPSAPGGTTTVSFSRISHNHADDDNPGGIYNNQGTVTLRTTVVAANTPNNCRTSPTTVPGCFN
ncbi:hypothetical protein [Streptomyces triticisoli]|jgi:hypothetical protein|uniref:hypothetical protein n=1 Tax=Streptomyces triticisoli TaxID=2182797 RepID=UPI000DD500C7|nr:hypothetical protein [Streptomyces triticisoli]